ncbi:MAG: hypothetical protein HRU20_14585 [Pseudomonadales bacterium]|nr:hypothetical protein [Pseudomonadales bacterium]
MHDLDAQLHRHLLISQIKIDQGAERFSTMALVTIDSLIWFKQQALEKKAAAKPMTKRAAVSAILMNEKAARLSEALKLLGKGDIDITVPVSDTTARITYLQAEKRATGKGSTARRKAAILELDTLMDKPKPITPKPAKLNSLDVDYLDDIVTGK